MPENFRRKGVRTDWADANKPGQTADCFIEGPAFDASGDLYIVDIPFGRIFRIAPDKSWSLVAEYDGWPNGMKIGKDGRILVADYMHGIMQLDAKTGHMRPVLTSRNSESFRGCNDLHIESNGDIYFTDRARPAKRPCRMRKTPLLPGEQDVVSPGGLIPQKHPGRRRRGCPGPSEISTPRSPEMPLTQSSILCPPPPPAPRPHQWNGANNTQRNQ